VRFYEKDQDGSGRDIRVWQIVHTGDGTYTAEYAASI
jgi:hypothetical protein